MADSNLILQLKRDSGSHASELKELCKATEKLMISYTNKDNVKTNIEKVDTLFWAYDEAHQKLITAMADSGSTEEMTSQYESTKSSRDELKTRIDQWLEAENKVTQDESDSVSLSQTSLQNVRRKRALAELKLKQLEQYQELERSRIELEQRKQRIQIEGELAEARLEESIFQEEEAGSSDVSTRTSNVVGQGFPVTTRTPLELHEPSSRTSNVVGQGFPVTTRTPLEIADPLTCHSTPVPTTPVSTSGNQNNSLDNVLGQLFAHLKASNDLPKPELLKFDGNPKEFSKFIHNFDSNVDCSVVDDKIKLNYLVQFCVGKAKQCVEPYILLPSNEGYRLARDALRDRFGQPHIVARAHLDSVVNGPVLKNGDVKGLEQLCADMNSCNITLMGMGFASDLNSSDNLRKIVKRLPHHMRGKWVDRAYSVVEKTGHEARFSDLSAFVMQCVKAASTMYGFDFSNETKNHESRKFESRKFESSKGVTSFATQSDVNNCGCCQGSCTNLSHCSKFKSLKFFDRKRVVRKLRLCDNCFGRRHVADECRKPKACTVPECNLKHHVLLHRWSESEKVVKSSIHCSTSVCSERKVAMAIVPVRVNGPKGKYVDTYALLDNGSDVSLCEEQLLDKLGIKGKPRSFEISTVNQVSSSRSGSEVFLDVAPVYGGDSVRLHRVWSVGRLPVSLDGLPGERELKKWSHLRDLSLPTVKDGEVMLLIGSDMPGVLCPLEVRRGKPSEPYAMRSCLGWTVIGPLCEGGQAKFNVNFQQGIDTSLDSQVKRMWETDFSDVKSQDSQGSMSVEDKLALRKMHSSLVFVDGHYRMALPWRDDDVKLPNNLGVAHARLNMLKKRLQRDGDMCKLYRETIEGYVQSGYARKLSAEEASQGGDRVWYLPHHPVVNENKPGKVRVVFDCAARSHGTSLNDNLLQGPDFVNSLVGVLMRFRQEQVAVAADVEAMFHQVKVDPKDHGSLRFLWWSDGDLNKAAEVYCMQVHLFGATSSPSCSAYALRRTAEDQSGEFNNMVVRTVQRNFYVDDCLKSVSSVATAVELCRDLRAMLANRGFRLTKWLSNDRAVLGSIPESERSPSVVSLDLDDLPCDRALGVRWNIETDCMEFKVKIKEKPETRRGILSVVSSLFDPLGLVAPVTLKAKAIVQNLCRLKLGWDDKIPMQDRDSWRKWLQELPELNNVQIKRCVKPAGFEKPSQVQVHVFSDASEYGYGACAYLRFENTSGEVHCALIIGKSRLAPIKQVSIPRLELSAAVVACRLQEMIEAEMEFEVDSFTFWTDSTIVLGYIRNVSSRFKTFVANRLSVIHEVTEVRQWRHVPGPLNPADLASRGIDAKDGPKLDVWINGPGFLWKDCSVWPSEESIRCAVPEDDIEVKVSVNTVVGADAVVKSGLEVLWTRFSSYVKLRRIVCWLLRYKQYCMSRYLRREVVVRTGSLSVAEYRCAENAVLKVVQSEVYPKEMQRLNVGKEVCLDSSLVKLCPIMEDGLIKVGGRLQASELDRGSKHPIVLPEKHPVTKIVVMDIHACNGHVGVRSVVAASRDRYWIFRAIGVVRRVIGGCFDCKRRAGAPCRQQMAPLPPERLRADKPPFTYVGVDYFGPIQVKVGRSLCKRYGCLFTCLTTRAIHVEIAHSLDTDSFLSAFRRFSSRRGSPEKVFSDNGTNFVGGERELKESLAKFNQERINREFLQREIEWQFNPPHASHMGGVYERMIRSVRRVLKALAGEQLLNDESLQTLTAEAERIVNDRPIAYVSCDPSDPQVLTPNMLLLLRSNSSLPPGVFCKSDSYPVRRWRQVQYLAGVFWRRWCREYLPSLQTRDKWQRPNRNVKVGDVVLVVTENTPRGKWPIAVVKDVQFGRDGFVRSCTIKRGGSELVRPVTGLCLLEATA